MPATENTAHPAPETTAKIYSTPAMSAEAESEMLELPRPIRISGFVALALGLLSFVALWGAPMIIVPVLAILFAVFALRPYAGQRPVGYALASIGLFAAVLFAAWGLTQRHFRNQVLGQQAAQFAANWLDLLAHDDVELAVELQTRPARRQSASMPLSQYYSRSEEGQEAIRRFRETEPVEELLRAGNRVRWELLQQPRVYMRGGRERASTLWRDRSGTVSHAVKVDLEYDAASGSEPAQWTVESIAVHLDAADRQAL